MKIKPLFAWYDLWVGAFWDRKLRRLYVLPLPCLGFVIQFNKPDLVEVFRGVTCYPNEKTGAGSNANTSIRITTDHPPTAYVNKV